MQSSHLRSGFLVCLQCNRDAPELNRVINIDLKRRHRLVVRRQNLDKRVRRPIERAALRFDTKGNRSRRSGPHSRCGEDGNGGDCEKESDDLCWRARERHQAARAADTATARLRPVAPHPAGAHTGTLLRVVVS